MKKLFFVAFVLTILSCSEDPIVHTLFTSSNPLNGGSVTPSKAEYDNGESAQITAVGFLRIRISKLDRCIWI